MRKLPKVLLSALMIFGLFATNVSANNTLLIAANPNIHTTNYSKFYPSTAYFGQNSNELTLQLDAGEYKMGVYEIGAHYGLWLDTQVDADNDSTLPWSLLSRFLLTDDDVAYLRTHNKTIKVKTAFDPGVSNIQIAVGNGNYETVPGTQVPTTNYTDASDTQIPTTTPTTPSTPSTSVDNSGLNLSSYSSMNMNVYPNSRVTSVKASGTGFVVNGYMWETATNCIAGSTPWREIVFVNATDASVEKAYRKQVSNVYNTFLNTNMTATVNGKYRLDYANYTVTVNPSSMNAYRTNLPGYKMVQGDYYVYMRISNGKLSYLFPLKDVTLSDGTNMENTGTLPVGFSVYDAETRALKYTVK